VIRFKCACGKPLKVDNAVAGRPVQCPHCGATTQAPPAELSGPEALAAALRGAGGTTPDDIPTAEVVAGPPARTGRARPIPPEAAQAIKGLDALAKAGRPAPAAKPARRTPPKAARGRAATAAPGRSAIPNGRRPPAAGNTKNAAIIGGVAAVGIIVVAVISAALVGGGGNEAETKKNPAPETAVYETVDETPKSKGYRLHQPGELFGGLPYETEKEETAKPAPAPAGN